MIRRFSHILLPMVFLAFLIALWQFIASSQRVAFWIIPSPLAVLRVFVDHGQLLWSHTRITMFETLIGLGISIGAGVVIAILMDLSLWIRRILYPYLVISQTIPIIALAPLLIIWFGYGIQSKIFTVVLICVFPISLNLFDGLGQVPVEHIRLLRSMGAGKWKIFRYLKIPSAMPSFFTGLKLSATYSVMGAVIGEWLGGEGGLGIYMTRATKSYRTDHVFAVILVIILLSMTLFGIVLMLNRILLRWHFRKIEEYQDIVS